MSTTAHTASAFTPFAQAEFWGSQVAPVACDTALALSYANLVLGFWRDCKSRYASSPEPFYILELGAASGQFSHAFLLGFFEQFDAIAAPTERVVYVYTDADAAALQAARAHPKLTAYVKQGRLDFAQFDPAAPGPLTLLERNQSLIPHKMTYPPVIIANGVLSQLRQDMFFLDSHTLYEAWVAPMATATAPLAMQTAPTEPSPIRAHAEAAEDSGARLHYQKRPLSGSGYREAIHQELLEHYRQTLPTCTLYFPFQALALLKTLHNLQGRDALLLCADKGAHLPAEFLSQPEFQPHSAARPPFNFHALERIVHAQGGQAWRSVSEGSSSSSVLAAVISIQGPWPETQRAATQSLIGCNPADSQQIHQALAEDAEYLSLPQMLAFLRSAHWNDQLFSAFLPYLQLGGLAKNQQDLWRAALARIWAHHFPLSSDAYDLAFDLASLAASMHRWRYAIDLFSQSLTNKGPQAATQANIGIAHWQLGDLDKAERALRKALVLQQAEQQQADAEASFPDAEPVASDNPIQAQLDALGLWQSKSRRLLGPTAQVRPQANTQVIYLTLLGGHQAEALYMHQRHPLLAEQVGVRPLTSVQDAERWIQRESADTKTPLAVMHPQCGLIGLTVLETATPLHNGTHNLARFYYWIAPDHQNQGYGSQALALLHQFAQGYGIKYLVSSVHRSNQKSQRAMAKLGYQRLNFPTTGQAGDAELDYYQAVLRSGATASEFEHYQAFAAFLEAFGEPLSLAPFEGEEELEVTRLKIPAHTPAEVL